MPYDRHPSEPNTIRRTDRRIALQIYLLAALSYTFFFGGGGWNPNAQFDLTRAIVEQRTFRIDDYHENTGDIATSRGGIYANKAPGTSFMAAVPYAVLYGAERALGLNINDPRILTFNLYICTVMTSGLLGALIPALLYLYGRVHFGTPAPASLAVALLIAFATPLFLYSSVFFLHVPNAALLLLAFYFSAGNRTKDAVLAGLFGGLAVLTNYLGIFALIFIAHRTFAKSKDRVRAMAWFIIAASPSILAFGVYQTAAYGNPLSNPVALNEEFLHEGAWLGMFHADPWDALVGLTISPFRGLFYISPVLIFAIGAGIVIWRRRLFRQELFSILGIVAVFFGFNVSFVDWHAGWCVGPRYLIPIIPFLGLLMMHAVGVMRPIWLLTGAVAFANNLAAVAVNHLVSIDYRNPLSDYIYPVLLSGLFPRRVPWPPHVPPASGHVSTNMESVAVPPLAGPWGSFNLGEFVVGPGDPRSLLPLVIFLLAGSLFLYWKTQRLDDIARAEHRSGGAPHAP